MTESGHGGVDPAAIFRNAWGFFWMEAGASLGVPTHRRVGIQNFKQLVLTSSPGSRAVTAEGMA
jgi:hypothetical protein